MRDLKVIILGTSNVGKTAFVQRYLKGSFQENGSTIGASFSLKRWGDYSIAIWDTAGEEKFSGLSAFYCRGAGVAIFAYDLTDDDSFYSIRARFKELLKSANPDCLSIVIGTKSDLLGVPMVHSCSGQIKPTDANRLCHELNSPAELYDDMHREYLEKKTVQYRDVPFFETSAITGENVCAVFEYAFTEQILRRKSSLYRRGHEFEESINLSERVSPSLHSGCC